MDRLLAASGNLTEAESMSRTRAYTAAALGAGALVCAPGAAQAATDTKPTKATVKAALLHGSPFAGFEVSIPPTVVTPPHLRGKCALPIPSGTLTGVSSFSKTLEDHKTGGTLLSVRETAFAAPNARAAKKMFTGIRTVVTRCRTVEQGTGVSFTGRVTVKKATRVKGTQAAYALLNNGTQSTGKGDSAVVVTAKATEWIYLAGSYVVVIDAGQTSLKEGAHGYTGRTIDTRASRALAQQAATKAIAALH